MLGEILFTSPWVLSALIALPVLWWILRAVPPRARDIAFPAFFLLRDIQPKANTAEHTPLWLLLLRMGIVLLCILAFADPVSRPVEALAAKGNVLLAVDTQWSAAHRWPDRVQKMQETVARADRAGMGVVIVPTAPGADGSLTAYGVMTAEAARDFIRTLAPHPWPAEYERAFPVVEEVLREKNIGHAVFFSSGASVPERWIKLFDTVVHDTQTNNPYLLRQTAGFAFELERWHEEGKDVALRAYAADGALIDTLQVSFPAGKNKQEVVWKMLPEMRNKVAQVQASDSVTAAARVYLEGKSDRYHVGIISQHAREGEARDLLDEVYYVKKALEGSGSVTVDALPRLLQGEYSALLLPDGTSLADGEEEALMNWVLGGGVLVRFAGPNLASDIGSALLPVELRYGQRALSGSMTWGTPLHLAEIADTSPLYGLAVPADVTVKQQVLAEPSPEVFEKTWLRLEDGTPLVTGAAMGKGTVVLLHTTADPRWSDLCYSGLYVEMLERVAALGQGVVSYQGSEVLAPVMLMDGFGQLQMPDRGRNIVKSMMPEDVFVPSPETPPGIYGDQSRFAIFNLGEALTLTGSLAAVPASRVEAYAAQNELRLQPLLLKLALILLFLDTAVALWLRRTLVAVLCAGMVLLAPYSAVAAVERPADFVNSVNFAYVKTGDRALDEISRNGLAGLAKIVTTRTSIKVKGVASVDLETSELLYFPFIYWPMTEAQPYLSSRAAQNLQHYMDHGGVLVIDTRDRQFGDSAGNDSIGARKMRELTRSLRIAELTKVPEDHLLGRSFYLLHAFPGRYTGGEVWVEKEPDVHHDGITSVLIGAHDWAAAWSDHPADQARYRVEPDGEFQREQAYRFGVNLVMMALTGSYKADQIHVPHILERIGK